MQLRDDHVAMPMSPVASKDVLMELNSWSRPDSTSYWNAHEPIGALPVVPSADYMRHSMLDELRGNSELEKVARDSGFLKSDDSMPTVKYLPAPVLSARDAGEEKDQSSAYEDTPGGSSVSPGKRGRVAVRGKSRRSKSGRLSASARGSGDSGANASSTKGLRHFSLAVCNKVREKGVTTYNEVADELVKEFEDEEGKNDEKNIRRRVYDALNVLSAMDIIRKDKKDIHWIGLPDSSSMEMQNLQTELRSRAERVEKKEEHLVDLGTQLQLYKALIERNATTPPPFGADKLALPFIIVNTSNRAKIDLRVSADRSEYCFDFSSPFELHDDPHILTRLGFGENKGSGGGSGSQGGEGYGGGGSGAPNSQQTQDMGNGSSFNFSKRK